MFVANLEHMFATTGSVFNRGGINATVDSNRGSQAKQDSPGSSHAENDPTPSFQPNTTLNIG